MKQILLIHHRLPYPLTSGMDKVRFNIIRSLSTEYELHLIFPVQNIQIIPDKISKYCKVNQVIVNPRKRNILNRLLTYANLIFHNIPYYALVDYYKEVSISIQQLQKKCTFDAVVALSDYTGYYLKNIKSIKKILGPCDDMITEAFNSYQASEGILKKIAGCLNYLCVKVYQPKICSISDMTFFFNEDDGINVEKYSKKPFRWKILPVAIEESDEIPLKSFVSNRPIILFVGGLGPFFNQDAVLYFNSEILPSIIKSIPDCIFYIVGNNTPKKIKNLHNGINTIVTGEVDSVEEYMMKSQVYVSPLRYGTGIKTKIIEALRYGKAIVSTSKGIQGISLPDEEIVSIADSPSEFADKVIGLFIDIEKRTKIEQKARQLYLNNFSFQKIRKQTLNEFDCLLKEN